MLHTLKFLKSWWGGFTVGLLFAIFSSLTLSVIIEKEKSGESEVAWDFNTTRGPFNIMLSDKYEDFYLSLSLPDGRSIYITREGEYKNLRVDYKALDLSGEIGKYWSDVNGDGVFDMCRIKIDDRNVYYINLNHDWYAATAVGGGKFQVDNGKIYMFDLSGGWK